MQPAFVKPDEASDDEPLLIVNPTPLRIRSQSTNSTKTNNSKSNSNLTTSGSSSTSVVLSPVLQQRGSVEVRLNPLVEPMIVLRVSVKTNLPTHLRLTDGSPSHFTLRSGEKRTLVVRLKRGSPDASLRLLLDCEPALDEPYSSKKPILTAKKGLAESGAGQSTWKGRNFDMLHTFSVVVPVVVEEPDDQKLLAAIKSTRQAIEEKRESLSRVQAQCDEVLAEVETQRKELQAIVSRRPSLWKKCVRFVNDVEWMEVFGLLLVICSTAQLGLSL